MFKISNLNFQNQTIESIEVNGECIENLEIKLTKTKFSIVIVKDKKCIKKEIKKKDDIVDVIIEADIKEVVEEDIKEEVVEDIKEVIEKVTLAKIKDVLKEHIPKKNTLDSYGRTIQQVFEYFKVQTIHELLEQDIIDYIEEKYESISTIKTKLCAIYKVYRLLNIESELFKNRIEHYAYEQTLHQDKHRELNKKTVAEKDAIMGYFKDKLKELETTIQEDNWTHQNQLYCILKIYLTYGVLRPSEIIDLKIVECDEGNENINYYNVWTKELIIHNHKNDRKGVKVIQITDVKLRTILKLGLGCINPVLHLRKCLNLILMTIHRMIYGKRYHLFS